MRVAVLASGTGTNLQAILDRLHGREVEVVAVASDKPDAEALARAQAAGVETRTFPSPAGSSPHRTISPDPSTSPVPTTSPSDPTASPPYPTTSSPFATRADRDAAMAMWLEGRGAELVVLAGYMQLLTPDFLGRFPRRVINVHPALLPAFPGLRAIEQAVEHGVKVFGVTVHFVDEGVDTGPIIAQRALELPGAPTAEEVREALRPLEHDLLCDAVRALAAGAVEADPANPRRIAYRPARMGGSG